MPLTDDEYLDRLRTLQPLKRLTAYAMIIVGLPLAVGVGAWGLLQHRGVTASFDRLSAAAHPTTRQAADAIQHARDGISFSMGATTGIRFAPGLFLTLFGLVIIAGRRKDRLLLQRDRPTASR